MRIVLGLAMRLRSSDLTALRDNARMVNDPFRIQLARVLDWEEAHVSFDHAIEGLPASSRGALAPGFEHSIWQLLEHMRIAQEDLVDFCVNAKYVHSRKWPDDYWPAEPAPPDGAAWNASIASFKGGREQVKQIVRETNDLAAPVPTGEPHQTYLRAILLVADHNAYHLGQLVAVRRALGQWHR
jgi:hypothetical protein